MAKPEFSNKTPRFPSSLWLYLLVIKDLWSWNFFININDEQSCIKQRKGPNPWFFPHQFILCDSLKNALPRPPTAESLNDRGTQLLWSEIQGCLEPWTCSQPVNERSRDTEGDSSLGGTPSDCSLAEVNIPPWASLEHSSNPGPSLLIFLTVLLHSSHICTVVCQLSQSSLTPFPFPLTAISLPTILACSNLSWLLFLRDPWLLHSLTLSLKRYGHEITKERNLFTVIGITTIS